MKLFRNHIIAERESYSKSESNFSIDLFNEISVVSSAKLQGCVFLICRKRSFIYKLNSSGPNTVPCGTPVKHSDYVP